MWHGWGALMAAITLGKGIYDHLPARTGTGPFAQRMKALGAELRLAAVKLTDDIAVYRLTCAGNSFVAAVIDLGHGRVLFRVASGVMCPNGMTAGAERIVKRAIDKFDGATATLDEAGTRYRFEVEGVLAALDVDTFERLVNTVFPIVAGIDAELRRNGYR